MGLLDFMFGKQKHHAAPNTKGQSQSYNQGYQDGYRDAHEGVNCEDWECDCMDHNSYADQEDCATYFDEEYHNDDQDDYGNGCDSDSEEWN